MRIVLAILVFAAFAAAQSSSGTGSLQPDVSMSSSSGSDADSSLSMNSIPSASSSSSLDSMGSMDSMGSLSGSGSGSTSMDVGIPAAPVRKRKSKGGKVTIITNSNDLTDIQKPAKGRSSSEVEAQEKLRLEAEKAEVQRLKEMEELKKKERAAEDKRRKDAEAERQKEREEKERKERETKERQKKEQEDKERQEREKKEKEEREKREAEERAQNELKQKREREAREAAERAERERETQRRARRTRCKKPIKDPSPRAGEFTWPVYHYPHGWNFVGGWSYVSRATWVGDVNGDGKTDYARLGGRYIHFFVSKGDGQYWAPIYPFPQGWDFTHDENVWTTIPAIDLNGDKKMDIVRTYHTYNHAFISTGSDSECWQRDGWIPASCMSVTGFRYPSGWSFSGAWTWNSRSTITGDFNNDGKGDYARLGATYIHFFISKGDGSFFYPIYPYPEGFNFGWDENVWTSETMDVNADCRTDILRNSPRYNHMFLSATSKDDCWRKDGWIERRCMQVTTYHYPGGWTFAGGWNWNSKAFVKGDFNGDFKDDYARLGGRYIHLFVSRGDGSFFHPVYHFPGGWDFGHNEDVWATVPPGDFDGDGKVDILRTHWTYNHGFYSRGSNDACWHRNDNVPLDCFRITTFRYPGGWHFSGGWNFAHPFSTIVGDFNGDGKDDYINVNGGTYNHQFFSL